jgi:hypothetical protein
MCVWVCINTLYIHTYIYIYTYTHTHTHTHTHRGRDDDLLCRCRAHPKTLSVTWDHPAATASILLHRHQTLPHMWARLEALCLDDIQRRRGAAIFF